jgi:hypothetical protein
MPLRQATQSKQISIDKERLTQDCVETTGLQTIH